MTKEQIEQLQWLSQCAGTVVHNAADTRLPYELAVAIGRLDDSRGDCWHWIDQLVPTAPSALQQQSGDNNG